jgi:hypothetical protein
MTLDLLSRGRRSTISRGAFGINYDKRARLGGQREVERNNSCRDAAMSIAKLLAPLARAVAALRSAPVGPANDQGAKLRGQGPRAEAERGAPPACM